MAKTQRVSPVNRLSSIQRCECLLAGLEDRCKRPCEMRFKPGGNQAALG